MRGAPDRDAPGPIEEPGAEHAGAEPELLLYDFYKHMTTLSLATLGGVLSIPQFARETVPLDKLLLPVGLIAAAGVAAFGGLDAILRARLSGKPLPWHARWSRQLTGWCFGLCVGAFLGVLMGAVDR